MVDVEAVRRRVTQQFPKTLAYLASKEHVMCLHCQFGLQPVRLRRRWVHHFADTGTIVVCEERTLKCE